MYYGEKFNSITHLIGAVLALIGFGVLLTISVQENNLALTFSFILFGLTLILLYCMSTLYHSFRSPQLKKIFQKLDHISIYLLIAGTYTPYMMLLLSPQTGMLMMLLLWSLAILGLLMDIFIRKRIEWLQVTLYLGMGWICILNYGELKTAFPVAGLMWFVLGGVAYTSGVVFYILDELNKLRHAHGIWHLFVLSGSICHFISIAVYVR